MRGNRMKDSEKTALLTKIGYLQLKSMGCHTISTEVHIPLLLTVLRDWENKQDKHYNVDLMGIGWKYLPPSKQYKIKVQGINDQWYDRNIVKEPILRSIEIKVSRSDFKNGFVHCSAHYNYIMTPKGLINLKEVYSDIGVIEVDLDNFQFRKRRRSYPHEFEGLEIVRNPVFKNIPNIVVEDISSQIGVTLTNQVNRWLMEELIHFNGGDKDTD